MVSDPIADMLTRIKNAYLSRHQRVEVPYSKVKEKIGKILVAEGYLKKCQISISKKSREAGNDKCQTKKIVCQLVYKDGKPAFTDFKRASKPGRRIYARWGKIPRTISGYGTTIVSTSKGIMTDKEAREKKLGGEIICKVW